MSDFNQYAPPAAAGQVEQDYNVSRPGDELPTYDDLAEQGGPNSRFGRWRGWIEKRAAERYADITPQIRQQRRERGWGNDEPQLQGPEIINAPPTPTIHDSHSGMHQLHVKTSNLTLDSSVFSYETLPEPEETPLPPVPIISKTIRPTHLKINHFGSRFLPHCTSQIRCILPLLANRLILIGSDDGLSVLDMYPQDWTDGGHIAVKGPDEAQARVIWTGEVVYQLSILEQGDDATGTSPTGVVLALVGPDATTPGPESIRTLRMYNLASLTSLAKWAVASKGAKPLDMSRPPTWNVQQTPTNSSKRHRAQGSFARSLRSLIASDSDTKRHAPSPSTSSANYQQLLSPAGSITDRGFGRGGSGAGGRPSSRSRSPSPSSSSLHKPSRADSSDSWDMVDELPLRWATDFVPLASGNSRLAHASVLSYTLWNEGRKRGTGGQLLAVATKTNILLYETPKGERAFRFVKEFYTPLQPKTIRFFQQSVQETPRPLDPSAPYPGRGSLHSHSHSHSGSHHRKRSSTGGGASMPTDLTTAPVSTYTPQLGILATFDKKAGWIRLADSAVGEVELFTPNDDAVSIHSVGPGGGGRPRSRVSSGGGYTTSGIAMLDATKWAPPFKIELPVPSSSSSRMMMKRPGGLPSAGPSTVKKVYLLTKGLTTHIVPCPLPSNSQNYPPYKILRWRAAPTSVIARVVDPTDYDGSPPFMQVVALGELGVEVQEHGLSFLLTGTRTGGPTSPSSASGSGFTPDPKGKGKATSPTSPSSATETFTSVSGIEDVGGSAGFLCFGGHWDNPQLSYHFSSMLSRANSVASMDSVDFGAKMKKEEGMYCWVRKGAEDYRVFWIGGSLENEDEGDWGDEDESII
ncbi:hypothetical protein DL96DRAFT_1694545 [Flagelloscypha sp. PMI_526]|nr:hypothetical protein DL96DRAFT_1694545 [Flagelloscypha sp. PMI_526]